MAALRTAEIEALVTVNTDDVDRADKKIKATGERIEKTPLKVDADARPAIASMDRVEASAKKLVSQATAIKLDADISRVEKGMEKAKQRLTDLQVRALGGLDVTADTKRAEAVLQKFERNLAGLTAAREKIEIEVDPDEAQSALKRFLSRFRSQTEEAGAEGGRSLSKGLDSATRGAGEKVGQVVGGEIEDTLVSALAAIPIAGGIVLGGVAIGKAITGAIQDGLAVEKRGDRLEALTGLSPEQTARIGRAAGEAYSNVFGESIEANMDTARIGVQFGIIDRDATTRDAQQVVQGLSGIADVLGEDVQPVATAVTTLLRTGLAKSSKDAFDLLATGARNGVDRAQDMLDTFTEYPVVLRKLGLDGPQALGLLNQSLAAGARNSDVAADALKEFQIRATDSSESSADGFKRLGLNAKEMTAQIAEGGDSARAGLQLVLDKLRETEDPVVRNAAAVELFGTKAEDLGDALFAMDLTTAVDQLDGVTGSAQRMFDTLAGNDATKIEQAQRNIEVAADGIKGALAAAFSDPLGDAADWVSQNRGPMLQFFRDLALGALDFAESGGEGVEEFISGPIAGLYEALLGIQKLMNFDPFRDWSKEETLLEDLRGFKMPEEFDDTLDEIRTRLTDTLDPQIDLALVNDAAVRTAAALAVVEESTDGVTRAKDGTVRASAELAESLRAAVAAMGEEADAGAAAEQSQANLNDRWNQGREALIGQLEAMGLTREEAVALAESYGAVPADIATQVVLRGADAAEEAIDKAARDRVAQIRITLSEGGRAGSIGNRAFTAQAKGSVLEFMHDGGLRGLTPMQPLAQMVPASTWRVVGDRSDVPELYAPLDGSARSWALLLEGFRRMPGVMPMADGGIVSSRPPGGAGVAGELVSVKQDVYLAHLPPEEGAELAAQRLEAMLRRLP